MRNNLTEQLAWLGQCNSWQDVFGTRFDMPTLEKKVVAADPLPSLSVSSDWEPLWQRALSGSLFGGDPATTRSSGSRAPTARPLGARLGVPAQDIEDLGLGNELAGRGTAAVGVPAVQGFRPLEGAHLQPVSRVSNRSSRPPVHVANGLGPMTQPHGLVFPSPSTSPMPVPSHYDAAPTMQFTPATSSTSPRPVPSHYDAAPAMQFTPATSSMAAPRQYSGTSAMPFSAPAHAPATIALDMLDSLSYVPGSAMPQAAAAAPAAAAAAPAAPAAGRNFALFEDLRKWRSAKAAGSARKHYTLLTDKSLEAIAQQMPTTEGELLGIHGIGQAKAKSFGSEILHLVQRHVASHRDTQMPSQLQQQSPLLPQQQQHQQQLQLQQRQLQQHPMASGQVDDAMHPAKRARIEQPPEVIEDAMLNDEQRSVADRCLRGENLFITGAAGNGKSFLLRYIIQELQKRHQPGEVVITAPTGLAAVNIGGQTIHSFAGIGPMGDTLKAKDYPVRVIVNKIRSNTTVETRWKTMCALVIDEVSMLEPYLFEWLEHAARLVRGSRTCFGGVHLILCGDFLQLPPVESSKDLEAKHVFCFETPAWEKCGLSQGKIVLTRAVRQSGDLAFAQLLHDVRAGICSRPVWETLSSCHIQRKPKPNDGIEPTKLYCTNRDVDQENERRLAGLVGEVVTYSAEDRFGARQGRNEDATNPSNEKKKLKEMLNKKIPDKLHLKVAAQVVLLKNMPQKGLVNGSRGRVLKLEGNKNAVVVFDNGREHKVEMEQFTQSSASSTLYRKQLPLRLAWALTIHRSQGMTLTRAEVQLDDVFSHGQAYVALSRLTGFAGLWLGGRYPGISERSIRSHPRALEFYGLVKERSMPASA